MKILAQITWNCKCYIVIASNDGGEEPEERDFLELVCECVAERKAFSGPFRPRTVREALTRRANRQFDF